MALIRADRVKESSTSTGTGAFTLAGADSTYRTFASVCAVADTVYYAIAHRTSNEWEVGLGTYSATNALTRTTVHASSNANAAVTFSAGTKDVLLALTKTQLETYASLAGTETLTNKTINASNNTVTNVSLTTGVTGTLPLGNGGTGATTAQLAINALSGAVTSGSYLRGNGTNVVMTTIQAADVPTLNQNTTGTASGSVSGTASYVPKFTSTSVVGNSVIYETGSNVGIGTTVPAHSLVIASNGSLPLLNIYKSPDGVLRSAQQVATLGTSTSSSNSGTTGGNEYGILNLFMSGVARCQLFAYAGGGGANNYVLDGMSFGQTSAAAGQVVVAPVSAATKGLIVKGFTSQTANLQEWQNSAGTVLSSIDSSGNVGIGTTVPAHSLVIASNGSLPLLNIYKSPDGVLRSAQQVATLGTSTSSSNSGTTGGNEYGILNLFMSGVARCQLFAYAGGGGANNYVLDGMSFGQTSAAAGQVVVAPVSAATKGLIVKGFTSQTANLQEWQNSAGTVLSAVKSDGSIQPASMADSAATNNSIYYSTTASKLVYKDAAGTVNNLY